MAGDWIKMRIDLQTHPKVFRMVSALKADRLRIIGGLHIAWSIFDTHCDDGVLVGYTVDAMDAVVGWPGFTQAMIDVEWAGIQDDGSLVMPRFEEHNGASAKRRANDNERKRNDRKAKNVRNVSASDADKLRTREEKRREDKEQKPYGDDEVDHALNELAVGQHHGGGGSLSSLQGDGQVTEINPPDQQAERRHDHVANERRNDLAKGRTDDDADRHVDHISLDREGLELTDHAHWLIPCTDWLVAAV